MPWWLIVLLVLTALIAVICIRTARFKPAPCRSVEPEPVGLDTERPVSSLSGMIRIKTVSYRDRSREDEAAFSDFMQLLRELYPRLHEACPPEYPSDRSVIFRWRGRSDQRPLVLTAHYDVVPADESEWDVPPFSGLIRDGMIHGRGTLDTKGTLVSILEAAEALIAEGFVPANDIYLAFAGNEETAGQGAPANVAWLKAHGVRPFMVLDEGGAVVNGVFPGLKKPCAVVGTAEKGQMNVVFTAHAGGGHASAPPRHTLVGRLSRAVCRVEGSPFRFRLTAPARQMFNTLAPHSTLLYRVLFANLWCFSPLLDLYCRLSAGELNALTRTTVAFTQMTGGEATNVLPGAASVGANVRIIPGETQDTVLKRLRRIIRDRDIALSVPFGFDPSGIAVSQGEAFDRLTGAINATWPDALVTPYLMLACADARHYSGICDATYRFSAMALSKEERQMIHGKNERIPIDTLLTTVAFYHRLIRNS